MAGHADCDLANCADLADCAAHCRDHLGMIELRWLPHRNREVRWANHATGNAFNLDDLLTATETVHRFDLRKQVRLPVRPFHIGGCIPNPVSQSSRADRDTTVARRLVFAELDDLARGLRTFDH